MLLQVALCLLLRRQGQVREEATQDVQVQKPLGGPQQGVGDEGAQPGAGRAGRRSVQASRHNEAAGALKEHAACVGAHLHVCVCVSVNLSGFLESLGFKSHTEMPFLEFCVPRFLP